MKSLFVSCLLITSIACFSQNSKELAISFLSAEIGSFDAAKEVTSKVIDDGSTRVEGQYTNGDQMLEIRISIPQRREAMVKLESEIEEVLSMFKEMSDDGKMEFSPISQYNQKGGMTFSDERGFALIKYNQFVIQITLKGIAGMDEFKAFYDTLDFDLLQVAKG